MLGLRWILALAFASSSALVSAAQGNVLIVGPGGFSRIQDAVNAAQDGDTILVRRKFSDAFGIDIVGKALTIAGDLPSGLATTGGVRVGNLAAGETVVLSRLEFSSLQPLWLLGNAGSVRLVGCTARSDSLTPQVAVRITESSGSTALASCTLVGGDGGDDAKLQGYPGGFGLDVQDSLAAVFDSTLTGGAGGSSFFGWPGNGGAGASVTSLGGGPPARLLLSNTTVQGGRGCDMTDCFYGFPSGAGGPALVVGAGASARRLQTTLTGGAAGSALSCGPSGADGAPIVNSGILTSDPTSALGLTAPTLAREGQTISLKFTGVAGDRVVLLTGTQTIFRELPVGLLLVQPGPTAFPQRGPVGTIDASGTLVVDYDLPLLPDGVGALNLWFQGLAWHADGKRTSGSFSVVTVLDSAF